MSTDNLRMTLRPDQWELIVEALQFARMAMNESNSLSLTIDLKFARPFVKRRCIEIENKITESVPSITT